MLVWLSVKSTGNTALVAARSSRNVNRCHPERKRRISTIWIIKRLSKDGLFRFKESRCLLLCRGQNFGGNPEHTRRRNVGARIQKPSSSNQTRNLWSNLGAFVLSLRSSH